MEIIIGIVMGFVIIIGGYLIYRNNKAKADKAVADVKAGVQVVEDAGQKVVDTIKKV